jgi:hypothetical protein
MLKFAVILNGENALDLPAVFTTRPQAEFLLDKVKLLISSDYLIPFLNLESD